VVHVVTSYRDTEEIAGNPFWRAIADTNATRANVLRHNLDVLPGVELMPGILAEGDRVVATKKRYDCFLHTDLDFLLDTSRGQHAADHRGQHEQLCAGHHDRRVGPRLRVHRRHRLRRHRRRLRLPPGRP
jgi:hypothetical protein